MIKRRDFLGAISDMIVIGLIIIIMVSTISSYTLEKRVDAIEKNCEASVDSIYVELSKINEGINNILTIIMLEDENFETKHN
jgi:uncharacterized membrane protein